MIYYGDELYHHGVLGMKWGVRRYQNPDGSLTPAGKRRMLSVEKKLSNLTFGDAMRYFYDDRKTSGDYVRKTPMAKNFYKQNKDLIKEIQSDENLNLTDEASKARLAENRKIYLSRMNAYVDNMFKEIGKESSEIAKQFYKASINNPNKFTKDKTKIARYIGFMLENAAFSIVLPPGKIKVAAIVANAARFGTTEEARETNLKQKRLRNEKEYYDY